MPCNDLQRSFFEGGAFSGAQASELQNLDPQLARLIAAWPNLTASVRQVIVDLVVASAPPDPL